MDILNTTTVLALGLSGAMSVGAATTNVPDRHYLPGDKPVSTDDLLSADNLLPADNLSDPGFSGASAIISVSSPDLRVTLYDGIATLIGTAESFEQAQAAEQQIRDVQGIEYVINLITWG